MKKLISISLMLGLLMSGCTVPPPETAAPDVQKEESSQQITGVVSSLADGDTFNVVLSNDYQIPKDMNSTTNVNFSAGDEITIRLLLVDTPESVGEKAGMPYGAEASSYAKGLLQDKTVTIEFDEGDIKDKYDRYLAYVYLDGKRVQDYLLENGYAMIRYVYEPNTRYLSKLQAIEDTASKKEIGIWSINDYAIQGEGFNEVGVIPDIKGIGEDLKGKVQETAEDFFGETIDSLVDSFSNQ